MGLRAWWNHQFGGEDGRLANAYRKAFKDRYGFNPSKERVTGYINSKKKEDRINTAASKETVLNALPSLFKKKVNTADRKAVAAAGGIAAANKHNEDIEIGRRRMSKHFKDNAWKYGIGAGIAGIGLLGTAANLHKQKMMKMHYKNLQDRRKMIVAGLGATALLGGIGHGIGVGGKMLSARNAQQGNMGMGINPMASMMMSAVDGVIRPPMPMMNGAGPITGALHPISNAPPTIKQKLAGMALGAISKNPQLSQMAMGMAAKKMR